MQRSCPDSGVVTAIGSPSSMVVYAVMVTILFASCGRDPDPPHGSSSTPGPAGPVWVLDPQNPGSNLPPAGRSLFDHLMTGHEGGQSIYKVPFPFTALIKSLEQHVALDPVHSSLKRVLIPLNRSLQRNAARPHFFTYPRAVLAVDTEPAPSADSSGVLLKDRLFLGYQEKANIIEVISYNEGAGRFEFQVVKDYRAGGTATVFYANRAVCTVCHQNQGPIFARPLWDETNANPKIASLLEGERRSFYEFPVRQGVDIPNAIDESTDRANELSAYQLWWQDGCERPQSPNGSLDCRGDLVRLLLQYRLSGARAPDTGSSRYTNRFSSVFTTAWQDRWPNGLLIPNPDILNRDPFDFLSRSGSPASAHTMLTSSDERRGRSRIRSLFEPSISRGPLATWSAASDAGGMNHIVGGLSSFLAEADIRKLDAHLFQRGTDTKRAADRYEATCRYATRQDAGTAERVIVGCEGGFSMEGAVYLKAGKVERGTIDHLSFTTGEELVDLTVVRGSVLGRLELRQKRSGLHARRPDGNAIKDIAIRMEARPQPSGDRVGTATLTMLNDFTAVHTAIDAMGRETATGTSDVLARKPFRRARVMAALSHHLSMPSVKWCCLEDEGMPDAIADTESDGADATPLAGDGTPVAAITSFRRYCGTCHQGEDTFPPNFLHGSAAQVQEQVDHCAERIFFRLDMWRLPASDRLETPMPPATALRRWNMSPEQWVVHADLALLKDYAADILNARRGTTVSLEDVASQGYDNLNDCLPSAEPVDRAGLGRLQNSRISTGPMDTPRTTEAGSLDDRH